VDVSADIYIPKEATTADSTELLRKLVYEIADKIELPQPVVLGTGNGDDEIVIGAHKYENELKPKPTTEPQFIMDIDFRFKNTKANIPLQTPELTYLSNAMVRPIVAYINRNKTIVPIKCRVVLPLVKVISLLCWSTRTLHRSLILNIFFFNSLTLMDLGRPMTLC
jgi:distribution and morphology protein 31